MSNSLLAIETSYESEIVNHFGESEITSIEHQLTTIGSPFWYKHETGRIYKVELKNGEIWYVRTGSVFGYEYEMSTK